MCLFSLVPCTQTNPETDKAFILLFPKVMYVKDWYSDQQQFFIELEPYHDKYVCYFKDNETWP